MPLGTPYHGFILPYPIRVDKFTDLPPDYPIAPKLHLLTHTHSDHLNGLSSKSFGYTVVCSADAKQMLLRHEIFDERSMLEHGVRAERRRTFKHLSVPPLKRKDGTIEYGGRDLLRPILLRTPTEFDLGGEDVVTITAVDANHCPGSIMYLVQGSQGSILHTGDFRAEPSFLRSVTENKFLKPFLAQGGTKTLDAIYLDTACVWSCAEPPSKRTATDGLVDLMARFPATTYFFINAWTWGYEDMLTAVAIRFGSKIHVDRYKHSIYSHLSREGLSGFITRDMSSTKFHACERFNRCEVVERSGNSVVYVNPVPMGSEDWDRYLEATREKLKYGEEVTSLLCPLWRHSSSSELQAFINLFRPHRIIPNTLDPALENLDWMAIDTMFRDCLSSYGKSITESIREDVTKNLSEDDVSLSLDSWPELNVDAALKNLEGCAIDLAARWMTSDDKGLTKLGRIRQNLPESLQVRLGRGIPSAKTKVQVQVHSEERQIDGSEEGSEPSQETDEDFYDDRGNTAHRIFAGSSFIRSQTSVCSSAEEELFCTPLSSPGKTHHYHRPGSPTPLSTIFNQEYADWFTPITPPKRLPDPKYSIPKTLEPTQGTNILSPSTNKAFLPSDPAPTHTSAGMSTYSSSSTKSKGSPPPSIAAGRERRKTEREERKKISLKLGRARPDLVTKEFTEKFLGPVQEELR